MRRVRGRPRRGTTGRVEDTDSAPASARVRNRLARIGAKPGSADAVLDPLLKIYRATHPKADVAAIRKAYDIADRMHAGQTRKSGDPYITHPLAVATILAELGMTAPTLCAALLHDTVEDTAYTLEELRADFGDEVVRLVDGVTKLDKVKYGDSAQSETIRKMVVAMSRDIRVLVIKLADRLHNMRTLRYLRQDKQERIARETIEIFAPLAHRLGMNTIKWELEDLAFATLHPKVYDEIVRLVADRAPSREEFLERVVRDVESDLRHGKVKATVTGRPKHYFSIYQKMLVGGRDFADIFDLVGVRILVDSVADCYAVVGVLHARWNPIPGRFKDYICVPKFNMYQSLHTTVIGPQGKPVELQIRTRAMHRRAEYGVAAHWKYKEDAAAGAKTGEGPRQATTWCGCASCWTGSPRPSDSVDFLDSLRFEINNAGVYAYTPRGDLIQLPAKSTPVDFAYAVHTEVGPRLHRCARQRPAGVAGVRARERRRRRDLHLQVARRRAEPRLARLRREPAGAQQDPPVVHQGAARGGDRARQGPDRQADAQGGSAAAPAVQARDPRRPSPRSCTWPTSRRSTRRSARATSAAERRRAGHRPRRRSRGRRGGSRRGHDPCRGDRQRATAHREP